MEREVLDCGVMEELALDVGQTKRKFRDPIVTMEARHLQVCDSFEQEMKCMLLGDCQQFICKLNSQLHWSLLIAAKVRENRARQEDERKRQQREKEAQRQAREEAKQRERGEEMRRKQEAKRQEEMVQHEMLRLRREMEERRGLEQLVRHRYGILCWSGNIWNDPHIWLHLLQPPPPCDGFNGLMVTYWHVSLCWASTLTKTTVVEVTLWRIHEPFGRYHETSL